MKKRLITALILMAILVPIISIDQLLYLFHAVVILFVIIGTHEMIKLLDKEHKYSKFAQAVIHIGALAVYTSGLAWVRGMGVGEINDGISFNIHQIASYVSLLFTVLGLLALAVLDKNFDGKQLGHAILTVFYIGMGCSSIMILRVMGVRFIVYLFLITTMTDVFAYFFGMKFGVHKMVPHISPKKTWEGSIFGTVIATTIATVYAFNYGQLFGDQYPNILSTFKFHEKLGDISILIIIIIITFIASVCSQIGDLVASKFKRTYGVKDFGVIFPGHGGFIDRFDSSLFVGTFLFAVFLILQNISQIIGI